VTSKHYPKVRIYSANGHLVLREGLSVTLYAKHPHAQMAAGASRALDVYLNAVEPSALGLYVDADGYWQELDAAGWSYIRKSIQHPTHANIHLTDASVQQGRYHVGYQGRSFVPMPWAKDTSKWVSALSFWLPTDYLEEHGPKRMRELAIELASCLPFCSGHAGLSLHSETDLLGEEKGVRAQADRYPGMDIPEASLFSWEIGTKINGAHWLNFLGPPVLDELGGAAGLRARLRSPGTTVQEMGEGRAIITLGAEPDAGDTEAGRTLPAYRELARVLEPVLFHRQYPGNQEVPEHIRRWERRFLD